MANVHELVEEKEDIVPARKMLFRAVYFLNSSLHSIAELGAEQCFAGTVAQSNHSGGSCASSDKIEFKAWLKSLKGVIKFKKENHTKRDAVEATKVAEAIEAHEPLPDGQLDEQYAVTYPASYEKLRYPNKCWKQPHLAIFNLLDILESHKDINLNSEVTDWTKIDRAVKGIDSAVEYFFDGEIKFAERQKLKALSPPANFLHSKRYVPGPGTPPTGVQDVQELEIEKKP